MDVRASSYALLTQQVQYQIPRAYKFFLGKCGHAVIARDFIRDMQGPPRLA